MARQSALECRLSGNCIIKLIDPEPSYLVRQMQYLVQYAAAPDGDT
jgi:hypothetical protein